MSPEAHFADVIAKEVRQHIKLIFYTDNIEVPAERGVASLACA